MNPTERRMTALPRFLQTCDLTLFEGVLLTGSMVFGRNHTVDDQSDIDLIFIIKHSRIRQLKKYAPFSTIPFSDDFIAAFADKQIERFWLDHMVDNIRFNVGIWSSEFLDEFVKLHADFLKLGTSNPHTALVHATKADGGDFTYMPNVDRYRSIYIKIFPLRRGDNLLSSPTYNNLMASEVLYDPKEMIEPKLQELTDNLNKAYGSDWPTYFLKYIIDRSAPDYLTALRKRMLL